MQSWPPLVAGALRRTSTIDTHPDGATALVSGYAMQHMAITAGVEEKLPLGADGLHAVEPLRAHGMRRLRRLDLHTPSGGAARFDAHFRDSHVDGDGVETIVHEYTVAGQVDRVVGMTLGEVRDRVRSEFVGTSTCTHLNDTLRAIGDLDALFELRVR